MKKSFGLFKKKFSILILLFLGYFFNYLFNLFLSYHFNPQDYGNISLTIWCLFFFVPFTLLGSHLAIVRFLPEYYATKNFEQYHGFLRWGRKILLIGTLLILLTGMIMLVVSILADLIQIHNLDKYNPIIYSFWLIPLIGLFTFQNAVLQSLHKQILSSAIQSFYPVISILFLSLILLFFDKSNVYQVILSLGIAFILLIFLQRYLIQEMTKTIPFIKNSDNHNSRNLWRDVSMHMLLNSIIFSSIWIIDVMMLKLLDTHQTYSVAVFVVLNTISSVFLLVLSASNIFLGPVVSFLVHTDQFKPLQATLNQSLLFKFFFGCLLLMIILLLGDILLSYFGAIYIHYYDLLILFSAIYFMNLILCSGDSILLFSNHQHTLARISLFQLLLTIILDFIFIPKLGIAGAIYALGISMLLSKIITLTLAKRYFKGLKLLIFI